MHQAVYALRDQAAAGHADCPLNDGILRAIEGFLAVNSDVMTRCGSGSSLSTCLAKCQL